MITIASKVSAIQEGLRWDDLTQVQQRNARRVANSEPEPKPVPEGTPEDYRRMLEKLQVEMHPELQRFKLVPIKSLELLEAQWKEDQANYRRLLISFMNGGPARRSKQPSERAETDRSRRMFSKNPWPGNGRLNQSRNCAVEST
jgi:hypothetical protein